MKRIKDFMLNHVIFTTVAIMLISPVVVYWIVRILRDTKIVTIGTSDTWISFAGSIIGGGITMLALYFTIENENKKRKEDIDRQRRERMEDLAREIRPLINIQPKVSVDANEHLVRTTNEEPYKWYVFYLEIENYSNNFLKDLSIEHEEVYEYNGKKNYFEPITNDSLYYLGTITENLFEITKPGNCFKYQVNFEISDINLSRKTSGTSLKETIIFKFRDNLDLVEYIHKLDYKLSVQFDINGNLHLSVRDISNKGIGERFLR